MYWVKAVVGSATVGGAAWHYSLFHALPVADLRTLCATAAQIAGTMLGFVLAALAILATVGGTRLVRNMQKTGHYRHLLHRMFGSIVAFGCLTIFGLAALFVPELPASSAYGVLFLSVLSSVTLADVIRKFWIVMNNINTVAMS